MYGDKRTGHLQFWCLLVQEFVKGAVAHAMARDGSSGGTIRMVTIDAHGAQRHYFQGDQVCAVPLFS